MSIAINEIRRVFRYNGVALPDVPGMEAKEVRDLYSACLLYTSPSPRD